MRSRERRREIHVVSLYNLYIEIQLNYSRTPLSLFFFQSRIHICIIHKARFSLCLFNCFKLGFLLLLLFHWETTLFEVIPVSFLYDLVFFKNKFWWIMILWFSLFDYCVIFLIYEFFIDFVNFITFLLLDTFFRIQNMLVILHKH